MRNLFVPTVLASSDHGKVSDQLRGLLRGQWVKVNDMRARIVNAANGRVVLWMQSDQMLAVFP